MRARRRPAALYACCAAVLAAAQYARPAERTILAGADQAVWLVRHDANGATFDVAVRKAAAEWRRLAEGVTGRPAAAVASTAQLHLLFADPTGHLVVSLDDGNISPARDPNDPRWPRGAPPLALCEGADPNTGRAMGILAAVGRPVAPAGTGPATAPAEPATQAEGPAAREKMHVAVFHRPAGQWVFLADCPDVALPKGSGVFLAAVGRSIYLLVSDPAAGTNHLRRWDGSAWDSVPVEAEKSTAAALGMLNVGDRLVLLMARPAEDPNRRQVTIASWDAPGRGLEAQAILVGDQPATWPADALPQVTRLAEQIALLWREGGALRFGTCAPRMGQLVTMGEVNVFRVSPRRGISEELVPTLFWIVLLVVLVPLVILRPRQGFKPFALPPPLAAGNLAKRALAALIDLLPVSLPINLVYRMLPWAVPDEEVAEIFQRVIEGRQVDLPFQFVVVSFVFLLAYVAYGTVLEARFGATLGKKLMRLRVVGSEGHAADLRQCLLRNLFKLIELASLWPFLPLFLLVPVLTRYRQRIGDILARTAVINARTWPPAEGPQEGGPQQPGADRHSGRP